MIEKKTRAYAKLNLTLDITGKAKNGLHTLESYMQTVSLHDEISVAVDFDKPFSITLSAHPTLGFETVENLCYKAATAFKEAFGTEKGAVFINLEKKIPVKAGLGGGSSDCAAVLRLLGEIFGADKKKLEKVAASLGSDVPFFLYGGVSRVSGTGDVIEKTDITADAAYLLVKPDEGLSAAEVYAEFDRLGGELTDFTAKVETDGFTPENYGNGLEKAVFSLCGECENICKRLGNAGAAKAVVTGSGTVAFGVFENEEKAKKALAEFDDAAFTAVCRPIYSF